MSLLKRWIQGWALGGVVWAVAGCAAVPAVKQPMGIATGFGKLQADLASQFPDARPVERSGQGPWLPRALELAGSADPAFTTSLKSFANWCRTEGGELRDMVRPSVEPSRVTNDIKAIELMYRASAAGATSTIDVLSCFVAGRRYALVSGTGTGRRVVSWFAPDDAVEFLEPARAARAAAARERKATEERLAAERGRQFFAESPLGTQASCAQDMLGEQTPNDLTYRCGPYLVAFGDLNKLGWRITSQSVSAPDGASLVRVSRVMLLIEKVR